MAENNSTRQNRPQMRRPMGPGGRRGPGPIVEKPKNFRSALARLIRYIALYKVQIIVVALFSVCSTVFSVAAPKLLGNATTEIYNGVMRQAGGTGGIDFGALLSLLKLLGLLYVVSAVFSFLQEFIMNGVNQRIGQRLRSDINAKLHRLPMSYFDRHLSGEVLSFITNDVDTVTQGVAQSVTQVMSSVATVVGVLYMMITISVPMTLAVLLILPVSGLLVAQVVKRTQPLFKRRQAALAELTGIVEESYGGHTVLKAFNHEQASIEDFAVANESLYQASRKGAFFGGFIPPITDFMSNLSYVVVAVLGGWAATTGAITVGNIQSFIQYSRRLSQPINQVARISNTIQSTIAAAERVFEVLDEPEEPVTGTIVPDRWTSPGEVRFDHVRFGYDPEKVIIHDMSALAGSGKKIAIVGPTGAGKTTLVMLLMRFYDIQGGTIFVDGTDVRDMDRWGLRDLFGMVLQDTWLFSGTIRENIRYGRPSASDEEVYEAARAARADRFIRALPQGYDTVLNEESTNISQGQKQLLTIARAILSDPRVLILDEATSSVDTRTEILIQNAMDELMVGRTSFIIAHRLSTIRNADLILVMRDGDIVEQGTHEDLLAKGGFYAELYNSQFEHIA